MVNFLSKYQIALEEIMKKMAVYMVKTKGLSGKKLKKIIYKYGSDFKVVFVIADEQTPKRPGLIDLLPKNENEERRPQ